MCCAAAVSGVPNELADSPLLQGLMMVGARTITVSSNYDSDVYLTTKTPNTVTRTGPWESLGEMGYDKLLGKGRIDRAINITVAEASARAIEKVEAAGGSVTVGEDGDGDWDEWEEE